jgi:hypothetical protein
MADTTANLALVPLAYRTTVSLPSTLDIALWLIAVAVPKQSLKKMIALHIAF